MAIKSTWEPLSYKEAIEDELWRNSVADEIFALEDRDTWTVVDLPPDKKALTCMWVFRLKFIAEKLYEDANLVWWYVETIKLKVLTTQKPLLML